MYQLHVYCRGVSSIINRRYSEMRNLWLELQSIFPTKDCLHSFPPKSLIPLAKHVIDLRLKMLNELFRIWTDDLDIACSPQLFRFVGAPSMPPSPAPIRPYYRHTSSESSLSDPAWPRPSCAHTSEDESEHKLPIDCPILAQPMTDAVVLVPCGHSFSELGISQWLHNHQTCPTCRTEVICSLPNYTLRALVQQSIVRSP